MWLRYIYDSLFHFFLCILKFYCAIHIRLALQQDSYISMENLNILEGRLLREVFTCLGCLNQRISPSFPLQHISVSLNLNVISRILRKKHSTMKRRWFVISTFYLCLILSLEIFFKSSFRFLHFQLIRETDPVEYESKRPPLIAGIVNSLPSSLGQKNVFF